MANRHPDAFTRARRLMLIALFALSSGCSANRTASMGGMNAMLGVRPDEPAPTSDACKNFDNNVAYAQDLQESYHSRASMNRFSIYVAGILGLGTAAATGGLGAAGAAALTLTLLSVSGGFASGSFAVINNEQLALSYTFAANDIGRGITSAQADALPGTSDDCKTALKKLRCYLDRAKSDLETARTDNALGAAKRAEMQLTALKKVIAESEKTNTTTSTTVNPSVSSSSTVSTTTTTSTTSPDPCERGAAIP